MAGLHTDEVKGVARPHIGGRGRLHTGEAKVVAWQHSGEGKAVAALHIGEVKVVAGLHTVRQRL